MSTAAPSHSQIMAPTQAESSQPAGDDSFQKEFADIKHLIISDREKFGKLSFSKRLKYIIPILSNSWKDEIDKQMKKTLKVKILKNCSSKMW